MPTGAASSPSRTSVEYGNALAIAAEHLRKAAAVTTQPSLRKYLELRAAPSSRTTTIASDVAWMELDASIEPTIGPYETYEDEWFGYKAAFEAFVTIRDDAETAKLGGFGSQLQSLEDALPIDPSYRSAKLGALAPIRVVNVVFTAGDAKPRRPDRRVQPSERRPCGPGKRLEARDAEERAGRQVPEGVAADCRRRALAADRTTVSFDAFFTHILMHELMHGLGPQQVHGTSEGVRLALKDTYSTIEEAKADISGLWALQQLADKGVVSAAIAKSMYTTFVASVVPIDPLRPQRGARPRHRPANQLPARPRRGDRQRRWHLRRRRCRRCARPSRA